jgi:E3 SUMO-protein ligase PIAS1
VVECKGEHPICKVIDPHHFSYSRESPVREQTRDSVELKVNLSPSIAADLQTDPTLRVMIYCAADSGLKQFTKSDIAFPHQVELKANLDEVKANLRGLKNRPGTTQPADVTNYIRKKPNYTNNIVMTYALTQKVNRVAIPMGLSEILC